MVGVSLGLACYLHFHWREFVTDPEVLEGEMVRWMKQLQCCWSGPIYRSVLNNKIACRFTAVA